MVFLNGGCRWGEGVPWLIGYAIFIFHYKVNYVKRIFEGDHKEEKKLVVLNDGIKWYY